MRYVVAKGIAIFFGITTVILFLVAREGVLFQIVGSTAVGVTIYMVNTALLIASLVYYIWQRALKDNPRHSELEILASVSQPETDNTEHVSRRYVITNDDFMKIASSSGGQVSITTQREFSTMRNGQVVELATVADGEAPLYARVVSINSRVTVLTTKDSMSATENITSIIK